MNIKFCCFLFFIVFYNICTLNLSAFEYKKYKENNRLIHYVIIKPQEFDIKYIKANDHKNSKNRELLSDIASRKNAVIAINGGFFDIGRGVDGKPTGTLVIEGKKYNFKNINQALLMLDNNKFYIKQGNPKNYYKKNISILSGIPLLVNNGKINDKILNKNSDFYLKDHARTAVGLKADGTIILVVVENNYIRDLMSITMGEVQSLIKNKVNNLMAKYNKKHIGELTLDELHEFLTEEYKSYDNIAGLSIVDLAKFMQKLGCQHAINLDGGGSSALWINNKIVNKTIGDADESNGMNIERQISDAIIFINR